MPDLTPLAFAAHGRREQLADVDVDGGDAGDVLRADGEGGIDAPAEPELLLREGAAAVLRVGETSSRTARGGGPQASPMQEGRAARARALMTSEREQDEVPTC